MPVPDATDNRPIFVTGCPCSGATVLRRVLIAHSAVAMPRKTRLLPALWRRAGDFGDLRRQQNRERLADWLVRRRKALLGGADIDAEVVRADLVARATTLAAAADIVFGAYAAGQGKHRWGDQRADYLHRSGPLFALFPSAQLVHLIRDPRTCAGCLKSASWWRGGVAASAAEWVDAVAAGRRLRRRLSARRYTEVSYERLLDEPRATLARLCGFLGEPFEEPMLAALTGVRQTQEPGLTPNEVRLVEWAARRPMVRCGYEPVAVPLYPPPKPVVRYLHLRARRRGDRLVATARRLARP